MERVVRLGAGSSQGGRCQLGVVRTLGMGSPQPQTSSTEMPLAPPVLPGEALADARAALKDGTVTPMIRQYLEIKEANPNAVLFFRLGDFYEMFFEDAVQASEILQITLTARSKGADRIP